MSKWCQNKLPRYIHGDTDHYLIKIVIKPINWIIVDINARSWANLTRVYSYDILQQISKRNETKICDHVNWQKNWITQIKFMLWW